MTKPSFKGQCLCGAIHYHWEGLPSTMTHCHCQMCRRQHGAGFATYVRIPTQDLHIEVDEARGSLSKYASSPEVNRCFCSTCGSSLFFLYLPAPHITFVSAGTIDDTQTL